MNLDEDFKKIDAHFEHIQTELEDIVTYIDARFKEQMKQIHEEVANSASYLDSRFTQRFDKLEYLVEALLKDHEERIRQIESN